MTPALPAPTGSPGHSCSVRVPNEHVGSEPLTAQDEGSAFSTQHTYRTRAQARGVRAAAALGATWMLRPPPQIPPCTVAAPPDPDPYRRVSGEGCLEQLSHCPENNLGLAAGLPLNATALTFSEPMCPGGSSQSSPNSALSALHPGSEGLQGPPGGVGPTASGPRSAWLQTPPA